VTKVYVVYTASAYGDDTRFDSAWSTKALADKRAAVLATSSTHVAHPRLDVPHVLMFDVDRLDHLRAVE
jgi:hypothetical protein